MRDPLSAVDQIVQQAQEAGQFDDLPGKGKPLQLDPSPDAVVNNLLKEAGVVPEWVELAREIERLEGETQRLRDAFQEEYHRRCAALTAQPAAPPDAGPTPSLPFRERLRRALAACLRGAGCASDDPTQDASPAALRRR